MKNEAALMILMDRVSRDPPGLRAVGAQPAQGAGRSGSSRCECGRRCGGWKLSHKGAV